MYIGSFITKISKKSIIEKNQKIAPQNWWCFMACRLCFVTVLSNKPLAL
jgi:hypothetical protein